MDVKKANESGGCDETNELRQEPGLLNCVPNCVFRMSHMN